MRKKIFHNIQKELITKKNNISKYNKIYKCVFQCPINLNDCINSIDLIDDKVIIGTIMGDVNLCRVDENNLLQKIQNNNNIANSNESIDDISNDSHSPIENNYDNKNNINEEITNENNGIKCIQLKKNNNANNQNDESIDTINFKNYKINKKSEINKEEKTRNDKMKNIKLNNQSNDSANIELKSIMDKQIIKAKKISNKKEKKKKENLRYDNTNIKDSSLNDSENNISSEEKDSIYNNKNQKLFEDIKFPQITKLVSKSNENIPCLEFDTDDKINISIGDFEIICLENMSNFNINDNNSSYNYIKIKNYKNDSQHVKYCEKCTCMMNSSNFLIIFTDFGEFNSNIKIERFKYKNRNLRTFKIVSGYIEMSNFSIPFDFDGDRFLFIDYQTKEIRRICIYYTKSEKERYEYNISKDFGHISHMKIIYNEDNKIFLCRNNNLCEIHLADKNFTCIESWNHIGNDTISSYIYIKESKLTEKFKKKIKYKQIKKNKINYDKNGYENDIIKNNNKRIKQKNNRLNNKNKNINLEIPGSSSILNINNNTLLSSSNNRKPNRKFFPYQYHHTENISKQRKNKNIKSLSSQNNSSRREFNDLSKKRQKSSKNDGVEIFNKNQLNDNIIDINIQNNLIEKNYNKIFKKGKRKSNKSYKDNNTIDIEKENNNKTNYYIITLDKNGNVNLYKNQKIEKIFNLYEIENIDENYKKKEFFSMGFPYYIIMNELYIAITTDHGLFVISNNNEE